MPNNPSSFRLPVIFSEDVHPEVVDALRNQDDAITDIQQAIPYLKGSIDSNTTAIASGTGSTSGGGTETVIISQPSPSQNVIGAVNDQTGNTAYTTTPTDYGAFIVLNDASPVAVTLATATTVQTPWFATFINLGVGTVTITPATGAINGSGSFALPTGTSTSVAYDGTNFDAEPIAAGAAFTLTTSGTSGPATYSGGTLNIPNYTAGTYSLGGTLSSGAVALGAGAGSGATSTIFGQDGNHVIAINTGSAPAGAGATIATITLTASRGRTSYPVFTVGSGGAQPTSFPQIPMFGAATTSYVISAGATPLAAGTVYVFNVSVP